MTELTPISSLGSFSVSLAVKDIKASRAFYETLGFSAMHDSSEQGWLILTNGKVVIGLFQGMFENNILTFNPGWGEMAQPLSEFTDVRDIQKDLKSKGLEITTEVASDNGPGHLILTDPDGSYHARSACVGRLNTLADGERLTALDVYYIRSVGQHHIGQCDGEAKHKADSYELKKARCVFHNSLS